MGSKQSKIAKSPHDILEISPVSTKKEIKDKYLKLMWMAHPNAKNKRNSCLLDASSINEAYNSLMKSPPLFEFYTENLFKTDLKKYADDFFERVSNYCGIENAPRFCEPDFERFYHIFTNFRSKKGSNISEEFCSAVRRTARLVKKLDGRVFTSSLNVAAAVEKSAPVIRKKKQKIYSFCCECCRKGFGSSNQLVNHFRSKKHFENVKAVVINPKEHIEDQISRYTQNWGVFAVQNIAITEQRLTSDAEETSTPQKLEATSVGRHTFKKEPPVFRTCAKCKLVFETRNELILHLKDVHTT